ncbi:FadR/GntR family transcriptional regulator [Microbacterium sp. NPDC059771]|uniref:FadR/GntR family transcriptional regulator n=1 Tax=unclassified Microbacterium TaxID=2609290 RepID=UPI00364DF008
MTVARGASSADHHLPRTTVPKASSILANELRTSIVRGKLTAGTPFPSEAEIIETSGLSRATVREALRLLEAEGLIVSRRGPGGGLRVGQLDLQSTVRTIAVHLAMSEATLGDAFAFRRLIERECARLAAANATDAQRERLREAVAEQPHPLSEVIDFHDLIAECTGNEFFRVAQKIVVSIAGWHTPDEGLDDHDLVFAKAAHTKVVQRILARDGEGAARAMDRHLEAFERIVEERGNLDKPVIRASSWT